MSATLASRSAQTGNVAQDYKKKRYIMVVAKGAEEATMAIAYTTRESHACGTSPEIVQYFTQVNKHS
jgi:hypothetical protein